MQNSLAFFLFPSSDKNTKVWRCALEWQGPYMLQGFIKKSISVKFKTSLHGFSLLLASVSFVWEVRKKCKVDCSFYLVGFLVVHEMLRTLSRLELGLYWTLREKCCSDVICCPVYWYGTKRMEMVQAWVAGMCVIALHDSWKPTCREKS